MTLLDRGFLHRFRETELGQGFVFSYKYRMHVCVLLILFFFIVKEYNES